jgi:hypothetical protein
MLRVAFRCLESESDSYFMTDSDRACARHDPPPPTLAQLSPFATAVSFKGVSLTTSRFFQVHRVSAHTVTIVMEYCDDGDIAEKIGRRKHAQNHFDEVQVK